MKRTTLINDKSEELTVTAALQQWGNQPPCFNVTGQLWKVDKKGQRCEKYCLFSGKLHKLILSAWPDLTDLVRLHNANISGVHSHVVDITFRWHTRNDFSYVASLLRITEAEAKELPTTKDEFAAAVNAMLPRFEAEAKAAIEKYGLTVERSYEF